MEGKDFRNYLLHHMMPEDIYINNSEQRKLTSGTELLLFNRDNQYYNAPVTPYE